MVRNRNNNTLKNHKNVALNKDDEVCGILFPFTIPLAKQVSSV